jgi:hypothetical protein
VQIIVGAGKFGDKRWREFGRAPQMGERRIAGEAAIAELKQVLLIFAPGVGADLAAGVGARFRHWRRVFCAARTLRQKPVAEGRTSTAGADPLAGYGAFESSIWGDEPGEARN